MCFLIRVKTKNVAFFWSGSLPQGFLNILKTNVTLLYDLLVIEKSCFFFLYFYFETSKKELVLRAVSQKAELGLYPPRMRGIY